MKNLKAIQHVDQDFRLIFSEEVMPGDALLHRGLVLVVRDVLPDIDGTIVIRFNHTNTSIVSPWGYPFIVTNRGTH
jgi:hypothetical protein